MTYRQRVQRSSSRHLNEAWGVVSNKRRFLANWLRKHGVSSKPDQDDILADTVIRLSLAPLSADGNIDVRLAWHALKQTAVDYARRRHRQQRMSSLCFEAEAIAAESAADNLARLESLRRAIARLPDEDQNLVTRHWFNGEPQQEIAREVGVCSGTISRRLAKALNALRESPEFGRHETLEV